MCLKNDFITTEKLLKYAVIYFKTLSSYFTFPSLKTGNIIWLFTNQGILTTFAYIAKNCYFSTLEDCLKGFDGKSEYN